jgi:alpha-beta hydrolase superfamily lysophospholipase
MRLASSSSKKKTAQSNVKSASKKTTKSGTRSDVASKHTKNEAAVASKPRKSIVKRFVIAFVTLIVLVGAYFGVTYFGSQAIYNTAYKAVGKFDYPLAEYGQYDALLSADYADYRPFMSRRIIKFPSGENTLTGYLYGSQEGVVNGVVVISHGIYSNADSYLAEIKYFLECGWMVFAFNDTGVYPSEGDSLVGLSQAPRDMVAALAYLEQYAPLPLLLYGHSMGGYATAAAFNYIDETWNVFGAVTMSGFNTPKEVTDEQFTNYIPVQLPFVSGFIEGFESKPYETDPMDWNLSAVNGINTANRPVLVFQGTNDEVVSLDGSSIAAHFEEIKNPFAKLIYREDAWNNGHETIFLTAESAAYRDEANAAFAEAAALHKNEEYRDWIPQWELEYGFDVFKYRELDPEMMDSINRFFLSCSNMTYEDFE